MRHRIAGGASLGVALLIVGVVSAAALESGPQVGKAVFTPFNPLHVNGAGAGGRSCLVWKNGGNPVAMIFAREVSDPLTSLVKKIDAATAKNSGCRMGSFVVFLSDDEGLEKQLKGLATKEKIAKTVLAIDNPAGPKGYKIAKDADVTVVLYNKRKVKVNHAYKKGELTDQEVSKIVSELKAILPQKDKEKSVKK